MVGPPAWVLGEIEKPAGEKDMGGWKALVYTQEQQTRLGVDEEGNKVEAISGATASASEDAVVGGMGGLPPPWVLGEIEKPAGEKDMGGWKALVYTEEQQTRLGVDEEGNKVETISGATAPASGDPVVGGM
eukprot:TRINITY_DN7977_c1_g1_i4.p2 TRINITY_DN7977_c1_g1~~TRINITY_DN7977_c1_g1_i4.p2  ORF type:complete len:131 (+),score=39.05 TRINITY_DN7977_c1_g1_i4:40-432(+)